MLLSASRAVELDRRASIECYAEGEHGPNASLDERKLLSMRVMSSGSRLREAVALAPQIEFPQLRFDPGLISNARTSNFRLGA